MYLVSQEVHLNSPCERRQRMGAVRSNKSLIYLKFLHAFSVAQKNYVCVLSYILLYGND